MISLPSPSLLLSWLSVVWIRTGSKSSNIPCCNSKSTLRNGVLDYQLPAGTSSFICSQRIFHSRHRPLKIWKTHLRNQMYKIKFYKMRHFTSCIIYHRWPLNLIHNSKSLLINWKNVFKAIILIEKKFALRNKNCCWLAKRKLLGTLSRRLYIK